LCFYKKFGDGSRLFPEVGKFGPGVFIIIIVFLVSGFVEVLYDGCIIAIICNYLFNNLLFGFLLSSFNLYEFVLLIRCLMAACLFSGGGGDKSLWG